MSKVWIAIVALFLSVTSATFSGLLCTNAGCDDNCLEVRGVSSECTEFSDGSVIVQCQEESADYSVAFYGDSSCAELLGDTTGNLGDCEAVGESGAYFYNILCEHVDLDTTDSNTTTSDNEEPDFASGVIAGLVFAVFLIACLLLLLLLYLQYRVSQS